MARVSHSRPRGAALQRAALALAILVLGSVPTGAGAAAPTPTGRLGLQLIDVPVTSLDDPRARLYVVDHLAPGTVIHRRLQVSNTTTGPVRVALYPAAAAIVRHAFQGAAGHTRNELSTWTSVRPATLVIPARGKRRATVTIAVPRDASPGERYGAVWAEARAKPVAGQGITEINRVGMRIYLSVGPGGPPAGGFRIQSLVAARASDGRPLVRAQVHNTGGRALDMSGTLRLLHGPGGLTAGPFPARTGTTLGVGETAPVTVALDDRIPAGPWDARITLRSGLLQRSARASLTFPAPTRPSSSPVPGILIAAAALLLVGLLVRMVVLRRRR